MQCVLCVFFVDSNLLIHQAMADLFRNKYRISSARLQNWDYRWAAAYFVTICTHDRVHYFGDVIDGKMVLSELGTIAERYWADIPEHFPSVNLDAYVVMPNHVHGIVVINHVPNDGQLIETPNLGVSINCNRQTAAASEKWNPASLGVIINQYKRIVTIKSRKINPGFAWQSRFYDHIIRDGVSFDRIRAYIINNPRNWGG